MTNVLMILQSRTDGPAHYRSIGPLSQLRKEMNLNFMWDSVVDDSVLDLCDFVFMQRPYTEAHAKIAKMCRANNTRLWVDYDDLLTDVPVDNPNHSLYMNEKTQDNIKQILIHADIVTVSTQMLADQWSHLCDPVVIPNALHDKVLDLARPYEHKRQICWRGSPTHVRDLMSVTDELTEIGKTNPDVEWQFLGYNPWFLTERLPEKKVFVQPQLFLGDYFRSLCKLNPSTVIVPLVDNMFNRCKSNIARLEASLAGAVCIAPDWDEWGDVGVFPYSSDGNFKRMVDEAIKTESLASFHNNGWKYIQNNLILSKVNQKRKSIIQDLV